MGHEAERIRLKRLLGEITQASLSFLADPKAANDNSLDPILAEARQWQQTLSLIEAGLKSRSSWHEMIYEGERRGANAYAARQRLESMNQNLQELHGLKLQAAAALADFIAQVYDGPQPTKVALDTIKDAIDNVGDYKTQYNKMKGQHLNAPSDGQHVVAMIRQATPPSQPQPDFVLQSFDFMQVLLLLSGLLIALRQSRGKR